MDDETAYAIVDQEIQQGEFRRGLWTKALALNAYDENRAKAYYVKRRVKEIKADVRHQQSENLKEERESAQLEGKRERKRIAARIGRKKAELIPLERQHARKRLRWLALGTLISAGLSAVVLVTSEVYNKEFIVAAVLFSVLAGLVAYHVAETRPEQVRLKSDLEQLKEEEAALKEGQGYTLLNAIGAILFWCAVGYGLYAFFGSS